MARILIVEDYPVTQRVLSLTLRNGGHDVVVACDGVTALQKLQQNAVDLALVDIAMPEMDGLTLLCHLRQNEQFRNLPVIMLTASGQDEDRATALSMGADGFLAKPTSSRDLIEAVSRFV